jgi:hypothetical protein
MRFFPEKAEAEHDKRYGQQNKQEQKAHVGCYKDDTYRNKQNYLLEKRRQIMDEEALHLSDVVRHAAHKLARGSFGYLCNRELLYFRKKHIAKVNYKSVAGVNKQM